MTSPFSVPSQPIVLPIRSYIILALDSRRIQFTTSLFFCPVFKSSCNSSICVILAPACKTSANPEKIRSVYIYGAPKPDRSNTRHPWSLQMGACQAQGGQAGDCVTTRSCATSVVVRPHQPRVLAALADTASGTFHRHYRPEAGEGQRIEGTSMKPCTGSG